MACLCLCFKGLEARSRYRSYASAFRPYQPSSILSSKNVRYLGNQFLLINIKTIRRTENLPKMETYAANDDIQGSSDHSRRPTLPPWASWTVGAMLSVLLSLIKSNLSDLKTLKKAVDTTITTVENVAEVVEAIAEEVEKVADKVSENRPDDVNLKDAMKKVEDLAEKVVEEAKTIEAIIEKVEEVEKEVEEIFEHIVDKEKVEEVKK